MKRDFGKSLAFQKFNKSLELQIRNFWHIQTSLEYAERWWQSMAKPTWPKTLAKYPGDNKRPFTSIDIVPDEYLLNSSNVNRINIENAVVNFVTAFEVYLYDIIKRIVFLHPNVISNSELPIEAGVIGEHLTKNTLREWFSNKIADKYLRNSTHLKMLHKIQSIVKCDFKTTHVAEAEEWNKWTYVRNAIVHNGREVSEDLSRVWNTRFPNVGHPLNLTDKDCIRVHWLALKIGKIIDTGSLDHHIQLSDASLLIREIFIRNGVDQSDVLARTLFKILKLKMKRQEIDKVLGFQRRTNGLIEGWNFSNFNFQP